MEIAGKNFNPVGSEPRLKRVLVVVSPGLVAPDAPTESPLIERAVALATATGCELEFFHVCHDSSLTGPFFTDKESLRQEHRKRLERDSTLMAELAVRLQSRNVKIRHDTRWDAPRSDAILRKINESQPDLVMKQSREHTYVMGLVNNTDWDLVRRSPADLWFVSERGRNRIERLVTAVGADPDDEAMIRSLDYDAFHLAKYIAALFDAENFPVHAYEVPASLGQEVYAPVFAGAAYPVANPRLLDDTRREIAARHGESIEAFAKFFQIEPSNVRLVEGNPGVVVPETAEALDADLIVMAARSLSRWERVMESVTAEPVLAQSACDVVFAKGSSEASVSEYSEPATRGTPAYNLEMAVTAPERVFGTPANLASASGISFGLRRRILQIWEQDIRAQIVPEQEGGPVRSSNADLLQAIVVAQNQLEHDIERNGNEAIALSQ